MENSPDKAVNGPDEPIKPIQADKRFNPGRDPIEDTCQPAAGWQLQVGRRDAKPADQDERDERQNGADEREPPYAQCEGAGPSDQVQGQDGLDDGNQTEGKDDA